MEELEEINNNKFLLMIKGTGISMIMSLIMLFILSIILSLTDIKENVMIPSVIFISSFSILVGAFLVGKRVARNGIMYGSLLGLIYMLILYLISSILNSNFLLGLNSFIMIVFGVIGGAVGGIIGVNLK